MEEKPNYVIQVEEELPSLLRKARTEEMVGFDNYKENGHPFPHSISRFHPSHASTTTLVCYLFYLSLSTFAIKLGYKLIYYITKSDKIILVYYLLYLSLSTKIRL